MKSACQIVAALLETDEEAPEDFIERHSQPLIRAMEPWKLWARTLREAGLKVRQNGEALIITNPATGHFVEYLMDGDPDEEHGDVLTSMCHNFEQFWFNAIGQHLDGDVVDDGG